MHVAGDRNVTVKPGDVVLIEHEGNKKIGWPWGVVKEVFPSRDGKVRSALVRTAEGEFLRPLQQLLITEAALSNLDCPGEPLEIVIKDEAVPDNGVEENELVPESITTSRTEGPEFRTFWCLELFCKYN